MNPSRLDRSSPNPRRWWVGNGCSYLVVGSLLLAFADVSLAQEGKNDAEKALLEEVRQFAMKETLEGVRKIAEDKAGGAGVGLVVNFQAKFLTLTDQLTEKLRPTLRAELRLMSSAANPRPGQRRAIAIEGSRAVVLAGRNIAQIHPDLNLVRGMMPLGRLEPHQSIRSSVVVAAKKTLDADQFARYLKETEARVLDQRQARVADVVAHIDEILELNDGQQTKIQATLLEHFDETYYPSIEILLIYQDQIPMIPDVYVVPFLNQEQQYRWNLIPKTTFGRVNVNTLTASPLWFGNQKLVDDLEDPDEKAAFALVKQEGKK